MDTIPLSPLLGVSDPAAMERALHAGTKGDAAKAAAQQFEAILVRQLLGDSLKPMMGATQEGGGSGGDVYQYMITDIVAQSVAQGGGLGIAKMLIPQLTRQEPEPPASA